MKALESEPMTSRGAETARGEAVGDEHAEPHDTEPARERAVHDAKHEGKVAEAKTAEAKTAEVKTASDAKTSGVDKRAASKGKSKKNNVRKLRMERMMSKAELARRAGVSTLTIDRVENGYPCRMDTKRKILEALGLKPSDRLLVFGDED